MIIRPTPVITKPIHNKLVINKPHLPPARQRFNKLKERNVVAMQPPPPNKIIRKDKVVNRQRIQNGIRANLEKKNKMKRQARPTTKLGDQEKHDHLQ